ncbi:MAG: hypothetical protein RL594_758 [Bacteroidota bacterium]|jgi:signal peptidase I
MTDTGLAELTWKDIAVSAATAIAVAALLRIFVIGVFEIPSHSMENTLLSGDYILVNKLAYRLKSVHRGDVVVFGRATGDASGHEAYVKRVIGIPGDTILLDHDGISVNARPLPDPPEAKWPMDPIRSSERAPVRHIVGPDSVFVLGDNRRNSFDSRYWGCIPLGDISGSPFLIYWSFGATKERPLPHVRWERVFSRIY